MRTRSRTIVQDTLLAQPATNLGYTLTQCNGSTSTGSTSVAFSQQDINYVSETMRDELGRKSSHPVTHRAMSVAIQRHTGNVVIPSGTPMGKLTYGSDSSNWNSYRSVQHVDADTQLRAWDLTLNTLLPPKRWTITPNAYNESVLKEDCLERANGLEADIMLDLVEAHQIWGLIDTFTKSLPAFRLHWKRIRKNLTILSGSYLAWKFGVSPLISDIEAVHTYVSRLRHDIRHTQDRIRARYSRHVKLPCSFDSTPIISATVNGVKIYEINYIGTPIVEPTIRYVLTVEPTYVYTDRFFKAADRLLSRFATSPAQLAWELIPFSFVADWFVDFRGVLRAIDDVVRQVPYRVVDFTRSYSYKLLTGVNATGRNPCDGSTLYARNAGTIEYSHYERSLVSAKPSGIAWKPRFGKSQAAVSAALITQYLAKCRR